MIYRFFTGPELDHAATGRAVEQQTGTALQELPVIYVGPRQLPPEERVLLQQMCGLYNLLAQRGMPMPAGRWRSLTAAALDSVRQYHVTGDLSMARSIGATVSEWVQASEAALRSRTEFTTRGIIPPHF